MKYDRYRYRKSNVNRKIILIENQKKRWITKEGWEGGKTLINATYLWSATKKMTKRKAYRKRG